MKLEVDVSEVTKFFQNVASEQQFDAAMLIAVKQIGDELKKMLVRNTPVETGKLQAGWMTSKYKIRKEKDGYSVTLTNEVDYARSVNYGHYSHNQYNKGGKPYLVKNRVKVQERNTKHDNLKIDEPYYVFGHFFVEKSLLQLENSKVIERVLKKELNKWFKRCANGK